MTPGTYYPSARHCFDWNATARLIENHFGKQLRRDCQAQPDLRRWTRIVFLWAVEHRADLFYEVMNVFELTVDTGKASVIDGTRC